MNNEQRQLEGARRMADEFKRVYYDCLDNRRHEICTLYSDTAYFKWDGNHLQGRNQLERHFLELPPSRHELFTLDSQHTMGPPQEGKSKYIILVCGKVEYAGQKRRNFYQSLVVNAGNNEWKIISDSYGLQKLLN